MERKLFALLSLITWAFLCAGCATYGGGQVFASPTWEKSGGSAGKILLIVAGDQEKLGEPPHTSGKERTGVVTKAAIAALNKLPGTNVINASDLPALWVADVGDAQAVAQAKAKGADTVCVLTMSEYGGSFSMGIPELWSVRTDILYSLRLIDVKSGDLLTHAVIHRVNGGEFRLVPFDDLKKGMEQSLHYSLGHPPVAPAPVPTAAEAPHEPNSTSDHAAGLSG